MAGSAALPPDSGSPALATASTPAARLHLGPAALLTLALLSVAVGHAPALTGPFVWDDRVLISGPAGIQQQEDPLRALSGVFWADPLGNQTGRYYRPLAIASFIADDLLWEGHPAGFHVSNLLLHLICCALVFLLCRWGGAGPALAALLAAGFGLLPRLSESVDWISGRTDLIAAVGALTALWLHLGAREEDHFRRWLAAPALLLGLLGKEIAAVAALAIGTNALLGGPVHGQWVRRAREVLPATLAVGVYAGMRLASGADMTPQGAPALEGRIAHAFHALGTYAAMLLDPLRPRLRIGAIGSIDGWHVSLGIVSAAGLAWLGARALTRRWNTLRSTGLVLLAGGLFPVLHLLPIQSGTMAADRFLYVPAAGLALWIAGTLAGGPGERRAVLVLGCLVVPVFALATFERSAVWADEDRLWEHAVAHAHPADALVHFEQGELFFRRGDPAAALRAFERAQARRPDPDTAANIAACLGELGRYEESRIILERLVLEEPERPRHRFNLAITRVRLLDFDGAEAELAAALEHYPEWSEARRLLAGVGPLRDAWQALPRERADEPAALRLRRADLYARIGRREDASRHARLVADAADATPEQVGAARRLFTTHGG